MRADLRTAERHILRRGTHTKKKKVFKSRFHRPLSLREILEKQL